MNPLPTVYPRNLLNKPSSLPTQQTTCSLPRKNFFPDKLSTFQQGDIISTFQDLNESVPPGGFQFKELDNYIIYPSSLDGTKFLKMLESIKLGDELHVKLYCYLSGLFKVIMQQSKRKLFRELLYIRNTSPTTTMNS